MRSIGLIRTVLGGVALIAGLVVTPAGARGDAAAFPAFNRNGYNWSGYVARGSGFTSVTASWVVPVAACDSPHDLYAPWVGIDGYGSRTVEQTGVVTDCAGGAPAYRAWYEMYPAAPVSYANPVRGGDSFTGTITRGGTSYTLTIVDNTRGWSRTVTRSLTGGAVSAEMIVESPVGAYPRFGAVRFTNAAVNGAPLAAAHPVALDATSGGNTEDHTGPITAGSAFSVTYARE